MVRPILVSVSVMLRLESDEEEEEEGSGDCRERYCRRLLKLTILGFFALAFLSLVLQGTVKSGSPRFGLSDRQDRQTATRPALALALLRVTTWDETVSKTRSSRCARREIEQVVWVAWCT